MANPLRVLSGKGFLKVRGKDALHVTYNIEVFALIPSCRCTWRLLDLIMSCG